MVNSLQVPKGIDGIPQQQIPNDFTSNWFMNFIRTWLRAADVRNATAGPGITITGQGLTPATISISPGTGTLYTGTIVTASLTTLGTQGSMTFTNGVLTAQTAAT